MSILCTAEVAVRPGCWIAEPIIIPEYPRLVMPSVMIEGDGHKQCWRIQVRNIHPTREALLPPCIPLATLTRVDSIAWQPSTQASKPSRLPNWEEAIPTGYEGLAKAFASPPPTPIPRTVRRRRKIQAHRVATKQAERARYLAAAPAQVPAAPALAPLVDASDFIEGRRKVDLTDPSSVEAHQAAVWSELRKNMEGLTPDRQERLEDVVKKHHMV